MTDSRQLIFPIGASVSVVVLTGTIYYGTIIRESRGTDGPAPSFILIQLTSATSPYSAGEIVAINLSSIIAIGPVSA